MGKVIVITGAGSGLGRALARRFARDGETVVLLGRSLDKVQAVVDELGAQHLAVQCDVQSSESVRMAFAEIASRHPKIDVLINNAAVYEPLHIASMTDDQILQPILTNFAGPIFTSRAAIPMMENGGYIINVSSESVAKEFPLFSMYHSSKAGMERFTETLAIEVEPLGIRVSTVRCGPMWDADMTSNWAPEIAMEFHQLCLAAGINLGTRPISHVDGITNIFRALLDLPLDIRLNIVTLEGRRP